MSHSKEPPSKKITSLTKYKSILPYKIQKEITVQNGENCFTCKTRDWQKRKELQSSTKLSTLWRTARMYKTVTAVFHGSNPQNKTVWHKSTRPKEQPETASQTMCSNLLPWNSITVSWGQNNATIHVTSKRKDINSSVNSAMWPHSVTARPDYHLVSLIVSSDKILFSCSVWQYYLSVLSPPALTSNVFKLWHITYTPSCTSNQFVPSVHLPTFPQLPLPQTQIHSVSRMCIICLMNTAICKGLDDGWCFQRLHFVAGISNEGRQRENSASNCQLLSA